MTTHLDSTTTRERSGWRGRTPSRALSNCSSHVKEGRIRRRLETPDRRLLVHPWRRCPASKVRSERVERVRRFVRLRRGRLGELEGIVVVALLL